MGQGQQTVAHTCALPLGLRASARPLATTGATDAYLRAAWAAALRALRASSCMTRCVVRTEPHFPCFTQLAGTRPKEPRTCPQASPKQKTQAARLHRCIVSLSCFRRRAFSRALPIQT